MSGDEVLWYYKCTCDQGPLCQRVLYLEEAYVRFVDPVMDIDEEYDYNQIQICANGPARIGDWTMILPKKAVPVLLKRGAIPL